MTRPRFAISVPIGAWHPLLPDCIESLCAQGNAVEIAALDASGDRRVAETLDRFHDRFVYRRTGADAGQSDAIIEGWANTSAPFLGWLNADDALYPHALETVAKRLKAAPDVDVLYGDSTIIDDEAAYRGFHWAVKPPGERLLRDCIISQPSCFFRRAAVEDIGGLNRDLHYTMDWDLWVRLWRAGARFDFVDEVLSRVLWSRDAKTGGFNKARRAELERIIGANRGFVEKTKSRVGFALHHVLEYGVPASLSDRIRRRKAGRGRIIGGIDRAGRVHDCARLPLVHYGESPVRSFELFVSDGAAGSVSVGGATMPLAGGKNVVQIDRPIIKGDVATVTITPTSPTYLVSAAWV